MKSFSLEVLEYYELLKLIESYIQTPLGKEVLKNLRPIEERKDLEKQLALLEEALKLTTDLKISWSFIGISDPSQSLAILRISNSCLKATDLLELANLCEQAFDIRRKLELFKAEVPNIWERVKSLSESILKPVEQIRKTLRSDGDVNDEASPELLKIRKEILNLRNHIVKLLEKISQSIDKAVQDEIITQRNGRFVIPVKFDFKGKIAGVAHGFSSSGATVFIEPIEAVQMNNDLQILREKELEEIQRILFKLTELFRENLFLVEKAAEIIAEFDLLKAKIEFARDFNAIVPELNDESTLLLKEARHPLLEMNLRKEKKTIVPISFELTREKPLMIVSGANAGGKTVVLKTAGLLSLMALSALPVTALQAKVPFYNSVLADIGDRQSLSSNLSTFTSHITNIATMIEKCFPPSLILLDEVGTGTNPEEGSALGIAIVDYFHRRCKSQLIASTHYQGLKIYAAMNDHVTNACVEFNEKTLEPTYRLLIGFAGASSGIEIAKRFGLPQEIIEQAKQKLESSTQEINEYLSRLKKEIKIVEDLRIALEEEREATAQKYEMLEKQAEQKEKQRQEEFVRKLKEKLENFELQVRLFLESIEDKTLKAKLEKEANQQKSILRKQAISAVAELSGKTQSDEINFTEKPIQPGIKVFVKTLKTIGKVEKIEGKVVSVLIGSMRIKEKLDNLQPVIENQEKKEKPKETILRFFDIDNRLAELNLIGKTTFEIEDEIDRFLDKSYMNGLRRVRIVHGMGTGALRRAVHKFLKNHPHVERFTIAANDQGGEGATIVELKL